MPGKRKPKGEAKPKVEHGIYYCEPEAVWGGFINIRLDDEQKSSFFEWFEGSSGDVARLWDDLLIQEAKVTVVWDVEHQCYITTVAGTLVEGSSERYVSTSRAGTLLEAMALTVWKHFYLADGDYGNFRPKDGGFMSWG